jgi:hypothetical protein
VLLFQFDLHRLLTPTFTQVFISDEGIAEWIDAWLAKNSGWLRVIKARAIPHAPSDTARVMFGGLVIVLDGKAKKRSKTTGDVGERIIYTQVATVDDLLKMDLAAKIVLVWHENVRLTTDPSYFAATKKKTSKSATASTASKTSASSSSGKTSASSSSGKKAKK